MWQDVAYEKKKTERSVVVQHARIPSLEQRHVDVEQLVFVDQIGEPKVDEPARHHKWHDHGVGEAYHRHKKEHL